MRDLFISAVVFGSIPFILKRPWIGILIWCWLSYMNPHRLAWGFAYNFPFAMLIALATLTGMFFSKEPKAVPWTRETKLLLVFVGWMGVTTLFALIPDAAQAQFDKVFKIQLMVFVTLILINSRERIHAMIWAIALSLGFFGIKGGIFTILHGGVHRVQGPPGTFIGGNNELALALVMAIPLIRYLQIHAEKQWLRLGLGGAMLLSALAAIGSQSRGALLAICAMGGVLWLKSRNKVIIGVMAIVVTSAVIAIMPPEYYERMNTIASYQNDGSAMGRINAWWFAFNLAKDRPLLGGGFETFHPSLFDRYAPNPSAYHDVHSIYFEVLGEHGYVGLIMFILLGIFTWVTASRVRQSAALNPGQKWMDDLMAMVQVSLIGYAIGGAFLGLAYFDLYYHLICMVVLVSGLQRSGESRESVSLKASGYAPKQPV